MNKTQCPHCFTVYVISDDQMRASEGMVRCGTCRERFQAQLMTPEGAPKFDPSHAFIEPLSDQYPAETPQSNDFAEDSTEIEFSELASSTEVDSVSPVTSVDHYDFNENLNSELSIVIHDDAAEQNDPEDLARLEKAIQQELDLPDKHLESETPLEQASDDQAELIDQVDSLVQNKLLDSEAKELPTNQTEAEKKQDEELPYAELLSDNASAHNRLGVWFRGLTLLLIGFCLFSGLIYQLWLKQTISWPDDARVQMALQPFFDPLKQELDKVGLTVPIRRNLSQLELLSARTEAHPTRPSTILLKVSLVNRAQIEQPLPWLELSLTNADGRLVSRRNLAPKDYVFNNRIDGNIGAKQLKKVTIELLAFPEQATGYELRLLNL
jgi:predicted Zn finger-like uncharacterized protein